jgi:hypothetical protein
MKSDLRSYKREMAEYHRALAVSVEAARDSADGYRRDAKRMVRLAELHGKIANLTAQRLESSRRDYAKFIKESGK